jgi:hypothetical protein
MPDQLITKSILNSKLQIVLILLLSLASRLPFIAPGFGNDADAWRVVRAAKTIGKTGVYEVSRFPGFPVIEFGLVPFANLEPFVINSITVIFSLVMILFLWLILKEFKVNNRFFLTLTVALSPIILKNSVITMDYIWALSFIMGGLFWLARKKVILSGIFIGLAIGCRATSAIFLLPMLYLIQQADSEQRIRNATKLCLSTAAVGLVCFLPAIFTYGTDFLQLYDNEYPDLLQISKRMTVFLWSRLGLYAVVFFALGIVISPGKFRSSGESKPEAKFVVKLSVLTIVIFYLIFARLPHEPEYLLPTVPFTIIIFNHYLKKNMFYVFGCLIILSSFISPCRRSTICNGMVTSEYFTRQQDISQTHEILRAIERINEKAVILTAWYLPKLEYYASRYDLDDHLLVYLASRDELEGFTVNGYHVYYLPGIDKFNEQQHSVLPSEFQGKPLELD